MDLVFAFIHERKQFRHSRLAEFQLMQGKVADMYSHLVGHRSVPTSTPSARPAIAAIHSPQGLRKDAGRARSSTRAEKATWMRRRGDPRRWAQASATPTSTGRAPLARRQALRDRRRTRARSGCMLIGRELYAESSDRQRGPLAGRSAQDSGMRRQPARSPSPWSAGDAGGDWSAVVGCRRLDRRHVQG
jgi:isovaleryl-CoA dehydrogenase